MATASSVAALLHPTVPPWPRRARRCGAKCAASPGPSSGASWPNNPLGGGPGPQNSSLSGSRLSERLGKVTSTGRWGRGSVEGVEEGGAAEGDSTSSDDAVAPSSPGAAPRGDWADWQRVFAADEETERVVAGLEVRAFGPLSCHLFRGPLAARGDTRGEAAHPPTPSARSRTTRLPPRLP